LGRILSEGENSRDAKRRDSASRLPACRDGSGLSREITNQAVKQFYIFNGGMSTMSYPHHGLSTCKAHISYFLNNRNQINGEVQPQRPLAERTGIPQSTSNKLEKLD